MGSGDSGILSLLPNNNNKMETKWKCDGSGAPGVLLLTNNNINV